MIIGLIKNSVNATSYEKRYEKNSKPSLTVPDQTMSLREIVERYSRGIPYLGAQNFPIYEGEDEIFPDLKHMDLADKQTLMEGAADELKSIHDKKVAYEKAKLSKAAAKAAKIERDNATVIDIQPKE